MTIGTSPPWLSVVVLTTGVVTDAGKDETVCNETLLVARVAVDLGFETDIGVVGGGGAGCGKGMAAPDEEGFNKIDDCDIVLDLVCAPPPPATPDID